MIDEAMAHSAGKYRYRFREGTLDRVIRLAEDHRDRSPLWQLVQDPFLLAKIGWLYEHAPAFVFFGIQREGELERYVLDFAQSYQERFIQSAISVHGLKRLHQAHPLFSTTFWDRETWDPVGSVVQAHRRRLAGTEITIDFHPFNPTKLLPEEIPSEKRQALRRASEVTGVQISLHTPIIGPYTPEPNPRDGRQSFFDPHDNVDLMVETVGLARDLGAVSTCMHIIDPKKVEAHAEIVKSAQGSRVRVTVENYYEAPVPLTSAVFLEAVETIMARLPRRLVRENFGITFDVGHVNIEGEDPVVAVTRVAHFCKKHGVYLRLHATDNYGPLLFSPPNFSADVHNNISGRGIHNRAVIRYLRTAGFEPEIVGEQINALTRQDIQLVEEAFRQSANGTLQEILDKAVRELATLIADPLITPAIAAEEGYRFMAGEFGIPDLREHLVFRRIQDSRGVSTEEAKNLVENLVRLPINFRNRFVEYIDDLLLPVLYETGEAERKAIHLICQNVSGALFSALSSDQLNNIFLASRLLPKGAVVCREGEVGEEIYYVKSGEVTVTVDDEPVMTLGRGEIFGELSLFYDIRRTATVQVSSEEAEIGLLSRRDFHRILATQDESAQAVLHQLYSILPQRVRNMNQKFTTAFQSLLALSWATPELEKALDEIRFLPLQEEFREYRPTSEEMEHIFSERISLAAGTVLFEEGDPADCVYWIIQGGVRITRAKSDFEIFLSYLGEGEIVGEMALIDGMPRSTSVVTAGPTTLGVLRKEEFDRIMNERGLLQNRLVFLMVASMLYRIRRLDQLYKLIRTRAAQE